MIIDVPIKIPSQSHPFYDPKYVYNPLLNHGLWGLINTRGTGLLLLHFHFHYENGHIMKYPLAIYEYHYIPYNIDYNHHYPLLAVIHY